MYEIEGPARATPPNRPSALLCGCPHTLSLFESTNTLRPLGRQLLQPCAPHRASPFPIDFWSLGSDSIERFGQGGAVQHGQRQYGSADDAGGRFRDDPHLYQFEPFVWFFLKMLENALADIAVLRRRYRALQRLSESAVKVLACFKSAPERRLKPAELVAETGLVRRTVQNALVSLTAAGLLQRLGAGPGTRYQLIF